jgi:alpha-L-rhamnosidase
MLLKEDYPSWGYEIRNGATTLWERWNSIQPDGSFGPVDMNSFNHYAYGAVADWMHQSIGGIQPAEAGYHTAIIRPRIGGMLTSATGVLQTVYGRLSNAWQVSGDALTMNVTVPVNTTARVYVPSADSSQVTEGGQSPNSAAGVKNVTYDAAASMTVVTVGSGTYAFKGRVTSR